jgi:hypothetical protein
VRLRLIANKQRNGQCKVLNKNRLSLCEHLEHQVLNQCLLDELDMMDMLEEDSGLSPFLFNMFVVTLFRFFVIYILYKLSCVHI